MGNNANAVAHHDSLAHFPARGMNVGSGDFVSDAIICRVYLRGHEPCFEARGCVGHARTIGTFCRMGRKIGIIFQRLEKPEFLVQPVESNLHFLAALSVAALPELKRLKFGFLTFLWHDEKHVVRVVLDGAAFPCFSRLV